MCNRAILPPLSTHPPESRAFTALQQNESHITSLRYVSEGLTLRQQYRTLIIASNIRHHYHHVQAFRTAYNLNCRCPNSTVIPYFHFSYSKMTAENEFHHFIFFKCASQKSGESPKTLFCSDLDDTHRYQMMSRIKYRAAVEGPVK